MGVLNVTPDSFSDGGRYSSIDQAVRRAVLLEEEGADIIDIGGESSRPGAVPVSAEEELRRVIPVIKSIKGAVKVPISVDTYKSEVAEGALKAGASIVNDITALNGDKDMADTIARFDAGVVLMHMKGDPESMQDAPEYDDVVEEIFDYLKRSVERATGAGIDPEKMIVDPGIGFGKTLEQNLVVLKDLSRFKELGKPVLVGTSRKSFIGSITGKDVENRLWGTASSVSLAVSNGADIVRVHDAGEMKDVVKVTDAILKAGV